MPPPALTGAKPNAPPAQPKAGNNVLPRLWQLGGKWAPKRPKHHARALPPLPKTREEERKERAWPWHPEGQGGVSHSPRSRMPPSQPKAGRTTLPVAARGERGPRKGGESRTKPRCLPPPPHSPRHGAKKAPGQASRGRDACVSTRGEPKALVRSGDEAPTVQPPPNGVPRFPNGASPAPPPKAVHAS